jgi:hypothetical protein
MKASRDAEHRLDCVVVVAGGSRNRSEQAKRRQVRRAGSNAARRAGSRAGIDRSSVLDDSVPFSSGSSTDRGMWLLERALSDRQSVHQSDG